MNEGLLKGVIKYSIPSFITFILGTVSIIVLTRTFSSETYGSITIFNNTTTFLLSLAYLGLDSSFIRFYNEPPTGMNSKQLGFFLMSISIILTVLIFFLGIFFFGINLSYNLFGILSWILLFDALTSILSQIIIRYYTITYRMSFFAKKYSVLMISSQIMNKFFVLFAAFLTNNDIELILTVNVMGNLIIALILILFCRSDIKPNQFKIIPKDNFLIYRFALFSAPVPIIINLNTLILQSLIVNYIGKSAYGIYASAGYFTALLNVLQSGFTTYWSAYIYSNYKEKQEQIKQVHNYILIFIIIFFCILIIFKDFIFLLIGTEYHESKVFFGVVIFYPMLVLLNETTSYGISIKNKNYIKLISYASCVLITGLLGFILIPLFGLIGAAFASAGGGFVFYIICTIFGQKYYCSISDFHKSLIGTVELIIIMFISCFTNGVLQKLLMILAIIFTVIYYFPQISYLYEIIKNKINKKKQKEFNKK